MQARNRSTTWLIVLIIALFVARWPLDDYMCNPNTWHSPTEKTRSGEALSWRQPSTENGGESFFSTVFRGGGGTPAIFAMLGGQRYMVANILWQYSDVLFHQGKPYEMVYPLESAVTLNPTFTEAWSVYGWHLAWNLNTYSEDLARKAYWQRAGEKIYKRAIDANPEKPRPYFDQGWLYLQRIGDYNKAEAPLKYVVEATDDNGKPLFKPLTPKLKKRHLKDMDAIRERYWDPQIYSNRLAYVYKKLAIITASDEYFAKAIAAYQASLRVDPDDAAAKYNLKQLQIHRGDRAWIAEQRKTEAQYRESFGMTPIDFAKSEVAKKQVNVTSDLPVFAPKGPATSPSDVFDGEHKHHQ